MIKVRTLALSAVAFFGACFGEGPRPTEPSGATVVFRIPPAAPGMECSDSRYISSVAIGPPPTSVGYAAALPYLPSGNDHLSCNTQVQAPVQVSSFDGTGTTLQLGIAGMSDGSTKPRVSSTAAGAVWIYAETGGNAIVVDPGISTLSGSGGPATPKGLVVDDTTIYVAAASGSEGVGKPEVDNPQYPCCGPSGGGGGGNPSTISSIPIGGGAASALPITPTLYCETTDTCLVANATSLFYVEHVPTGADANIVSFPKAGVMAAEAVTISTIVPAQGASTAVPVGLAADDNHVVWSTSTEFANRPPPPAHCSIYAYDLAQQQISTLLDTGAFECLHLTLDGDSVYFAIVFEDDTQRFHGDGIGRISIASRGLESIRLGIQGDAAGPRRIYVSGEDLFAVDPFVVAKLSKHALDGQHDFVAN